MSHQTLARTCWRCPVCSLVFVDAAQLPSRATEQRHYDLHENSPDDPRYRNFLSRLAEPLLRHLPAGSFGLDYGSGPGPTLSVMLTEAGHRMNIYDPFYAPDRTVLNRQYDFITTTEVVEHFHHPAQEFALLWSLLKPGGLLGIMTQRLTPEIDFSKWYYQTDPTHVSFYALETFTWLARHYEAELEVPGKDTVLLRKTAASPGALEV